MNYVPTYLYVTYITKDNMLKGLVGLVTGAASGLGRGTAHHIVKNGGSVIMCDLKESSGYQVANNFGPAAIFSPCDVSSEYDVQASLDLCHEEHGKLDFVVNCAGMARAFKIYSKSNTFRAEDFNIVMKNGVIGAFNLMRLSVPMLSKNTPDEDGQRGVIIFTGSTDMFDGIKGQAAMSATSGAVNSMILPAARELSSLGIRVTSVAISLAESELTSADIMTVPVKEFYEAQMLAKRFATAEEFASTVSHIILNPMINGTDVRITSGMRHFDTGH